MNKIKLARLALPAALAAGSLGLAGGHSFAATTDPVLSNQAAVHLTNGKSADASAFYDRSHNQVHLNAHVDTPFLFYSAREHVKVTIFSNWPAGGTSPSWVQDVNLTACARTDPTCSSSPSASWDFAVPANIAQYASQITVNVTVN